MALTTEQVQNAYVAFFNRPADVEGLAYWKSYPGATADLYNTFAQSKEYNSLYANMNNTQAVNAVYQNLFGRSPDVEGLNYWVSQLSNGALKIGTIADAVNRGAQGTDAQIISNKVTAAVTFTQALDTAAEIVAYAGVNSTGLTAVKSWLATVGSSAVSLANAINATSLAAITNTVLTNVASTGTVSVLTVNSDNVLGTAADDTISGVNTSTSTQFTATDTVDGGAGVDTLKLELNASYGGGATVRNIEQISITSTVTDAGGSTGGTFNLAGISGLTLVENNASANNIGGGNDVQTFANVGSAANVSVKNTSGDTLVNYTDAALAGSADAVKLALDNVGGGAKISLNTTSAFNGIETLTVELAGAAGSASQAVTISSNAPTGRLVITGSGAANLVLDGTLASTALIDASAATGGVTLSAVGNVAHSVILGAGKDTLTLGAGNDTVTASAGGDRIFMGAGVDQFNANDVNGATNAAAPFTPGSTTFSTTGFHVISDLLAGEIVRLDSNYHTAVVGAATTSNVTLAALDNTTLADNQVNTLRGNFDVTTGIFTLNASGAATALVYDANATLGATDYQGIVLTGYQASGTALLSLLANGVNLTLV